MKRYTEIQPCKICNEEGMIVTPENHKITCVICGGIKEKEVVAVHPSHSMTEFKTEVLSPAGTPRFYAVRRCEKCEKEEWRHAAGHFMHGLEYPCSVLDV